MIVNVNRPPMPEPYSTRYILSGTGTEEYTTFLETMQDGTKYLKFPGQEAFVVGTNTLKSMAIHLAGIAKAL